VDGFVLSRACREGPHCLLPCGLAHLRVLLACLPLHPFACLSAVAAAWAGSVLFCSTCMRAFSLYLAGWKDSPAGCERGNVALLPVCLLRWDRTP